MDQQTTIIVVVGILNLLVLLWFATEIARLRNIERYLLDGINFLAAIAVKTGAINGIQERKRL